MLSTKRSVSRKIRIPTTTLAAAIDRFGPPGVLKLHRLPLPAVGPHDVLIALHTAGVGIWDADIRAGKWASGDEKFPRVLGTDGAGTVVARGARVRRLSVGERVWAYEFENPKGGFYAEYVVINAAQVAPVPESLTLVQAGTAAVTGLTALQGIDDVLRVRQAETVLIFGASGAVGTLAVQFAVRHGARVLAAASGSDGVALARRLGAMAAWDARTGDAAEQIHARAPGGLDAIFALAGGAALERCIDHAPGGRVAYPNGVEPPPRRRRGLEVRAYDAVGGWRAFARLNHAVNEMRLRVPIAASYSVVDAAAAHARVERGHLLGRIALRIRGGVGRSGRST